MGETAAETRGEITQTREELGGHLQELKHRADRQKKRGAGLAGAVGALGAIAAGGIVLLRRRRAGRLTKAAGRLPKALRSTTKPVARKADRLLSDAGDQARKSGGKAAEQLTRRYAEQHVEAEQRKNPVWRRAGQAALTSAATAAATAAVRRMMSGKDSQVR